MATYRIMLEIEQLPEGPYLGTSPDLPGLIIQADTPEEVIRLAPDIAHDLIGVMQDNGQSLPAHLESFPTPRQLPVMVPA
jgi:predicted RNase H-like HicB family nuclease